MKQSLILAAIAAAVAVGFSSCASKPAPQVPVQSGAYGAGAAGGGYTIQK